MKNYKVTFQVPSEKGLVSPISSASFSGFTDLFTSQVIHVSAEDTDTALKLAADVRWPSGCRIQDYSHEGWYQAEVFSGSEDLRYEDFQVLIEEV